MLTLGGYRFETAGVISTFVLLSHLFSDHVFIVGNEELRVPILGRSSTIGVVYNLAVAGAPVPRM